MNVVVNMIRSQKSNANITHLTVLYLQYESDSVSLLQLTWKTPERKRDECSFKGKDLQASELLKKLNSDGSNCIYMTEG